MVFLRAMLIGLLAFGAVNAAPTTQTQSRDSIEAADQPISQSSNFDLIDWLRRQIYEEERDLVVQQALKSWYSQNPYAAEQAQSELRESIKNQEEMNRSLQEQLSFNTTEDLEKKIKLDQLELDARRALLKKLSSMDEKQIKQVIAQYRDEFNTFQAVYGSGQSDAASLRSMLEQSLQNAKQGLEINQRAYETLVNNPEAAAKAEQLRQAVFRRMLDEGTISQRAYAKGEELGAVQALNKTVFMGEKIVHGLQIALEILDSQPSQVPTYTYQIQQMIQDPHFLQQIANDDFMTQEMTTNNSEFDTMQFGLGGLSGAGALRSLLPLLARQALRSPVPFGQFAGQAYGAGDGMLGQSGGFASPFIAYM